MVSILCIHLQYICVCTMRTIQYNSTHFTSAQLCCSPVTFVYQPNDHLCTFSIFLIEILPSFLGGFFFFLLLLLFLLLLSFLPWVAFFGRVGRLSEIDVVFACSRCRLRYVRVYVCYFFGGSRLLLYFVRSSATVTDVFFHCS